MELNPQSSSDNLKSNLWSKAEDLFEKSASLEQAYIAGYSTLFILGSSFGGKSSIIQRFLDSSSSNKTLNHVYQETIGLEYRFAKRFDENRWHPLGKTCHIWELGYGTLFIDLIELVLQPQCLRNSSIILVIDLTRPEEFSTLFKEVTEKIQSHLDFLLHNDSQLKKELEQTSADRSILFQPESNDHNPIKNPFLLPLTIVGNKYDEFQNMDPEKKKQIVRYLRTFAYFQGAQIIFTSSKSETLTKRVNQVLETLAFDQELLQKNDFNNAVKPTVSTNFSKPLALPFGYDSLSKIGVTNFIDIERQFEELFPQKDLNDSFKSTIQQDPRIDSNFSEPELDQILEYKYLLLKDSI